MIIAVVDGMGGGIGSETVSRIRRGLPPEVVILALGTNAIATDKMVKAGANRGATGENAIVFSASQVDIIVGPIGVVIPNSMMGEITPAIANGIVNAPAKKLLLPIEQPHLHIVGVAPKPLREQMEFVIEMIREMMKNSS